MPHLRFGRDRGGYETTALVQGGRRGRSRVLYFFRTPPGVRVGRGPLDEAAIRLLEEHNPDIEFDWTRILKRDADTGEAREHEPKPRVADREARRERRGGGGKERRRERPPQPDAREALEGSTPREPRPSPEPEVPSDATVLGADATSHPVTGVEAEAPEPEPIFTVSAEDEGTASYRRLGAEGLVRLRARYSEVLARLAEQPLDDERRDQLKTLAERLNPDAWVTDDDVREGVEQYEAVFESLRPHLGHRPRRRRRR